MKKTQFLALALASATIISAVPLDTRAAKKNTDVVYEDLEDEYSYGEEIVDDLFADDLAAYDAYLAGGSEETSGPIRLQWVSGDHDATIDASVAGHRLMKAAVKVPDDKNFNMFFGDNPLNLNRRFHGSKSYYMTLQYLVDLANAYYSKDDSRVQAVKNSCPAKLKTVETYTGGTFKYSTYDAIEIFIGNTNCFNLPGVDESTRHNKAYKLMGLAAHVMGDVYAHRTLVRLNDINKNTDKKYFKDWKGYEKKVKENIPTRTSYESAGLETRDISQYLKSDAELRTLTNNSKMTRSKLYEDNTTFKKERYNYAKKAVANIVNEGTVYDFRAHGWNQSCMPGQSSLRY